jgi:hypothetical protein
MTITRRGTAGAPAEPVAGKAPVQPRTIQSRVVQTQRSDRGGAIIPDMIPGSVCAVTLVDRRTGAALRVNGSRLVIYTRASEIAARELLDGRDPAVWDLRVQPLDPARRR